MSKQTERLMIRLGPELVSAVQSRRDNISAGVRESLERYYYLLEAERRVLKPQFTAGELALLADICNGTAWDTQSINFGLVANAEDAEQSYFEKWNVDQYELLVKLKNLTLSQNLAMIDAIERFWEAVSHSPSCDPGKLLD